MAEERIKTLDEMTDDEVIGVITINRENYNDEYLEKANDELNKREIDLDNVFSYCSAKYNNGEFEKIKITEALGKIELLKSKLDVLYFENYMKEFLAIQKHNDFFVVHFHNKENNPSSFFVDNKLGLEFAINEFLNYKECLPVNSEIENHWETFLESSSSKYIIRIADLLDKAEVPYSVNSPLLIRFSSFNNPYSIIMPAEFIEDAQDVLSTLDDLKEDFYTKLEDAEKKGEVEEQMKILNELESITPDDSALFYNKAQLLDEKGDYEGSVNAAIDSFNIDLANGEVEDIEDIENYLIDKLEKVENKIDVFHCLASIASFKNDIETAIDYYNRLLEIDENDSIAHLNLGHFYFSHTEEDNKIQFHFKKYIELNPNSEEIESIKEILKNINS